MGLKPHDGRASLRNVTTGMVPATIVIDTLEAEDIDADSATIRGEIVDMADGYPDAQVYFEWGEDGMGLPESTDLQSLGSVQIFTEELTGLTEDQQYEFRAHGELANVEDEGAVLTFTTEAAIPDSAIDYSEYTTDATPDDWSEWGSGATWVVDEDSSKIGGKYLDYDDDGTNSRTGLLWDDEGSFTDVEIAWSASSPAASESDMMQGVVRASGSDPASDGSAYICNIADESTGEVYLQKIVDGDLTSPISGAENETIGNWDPSEDVNFRFQAFGNDLKVRAWMAADAEPDSWMYEISDSDLTSGYVGVYQWRNSSDNPTEWDWFSYSETSEDAYIFESDSGNENVDVTIEDQLYTTSYDANSYALGGK